MKGSRPLTEEEIQKVSLAFNGKYEVRDRCLFILGIKTGMRISELLSLNVSDVWEKGRPVDILNLRKQQVKGKKEARAIPLNQAAKDAIQELVEWLSWNGGITLERASVRCIDTTPSPTLPRFKDTPLFPSQKGDRITRIQAHRILKRAYEAASLTGKVTTHSLRKSFGTNVYTVTKDIMVAKELLGHKSVATTQKYIGVGMDALRAAVDAI